MRLEKKKIYIEKEHDLPGFTGWYLHEITDQVSYIFNEKELLEFAKKIASEAWDKCWGVTGEGWNGEIDPIGFMDESIKQSFLEEKNEYLDSLKLD